MMKMITLSRKFKDHFLSEQGQSFVEFVVSLVFILLLLAGTIDLGKAFFVYLTVRDAAQEGAVYGSYCPKNPSGIVSRVRNSSTFPIDLTNTTAVTVACQYVYTSGAPTSCAANGTVAAGDGVRLTVTYNNFAITTPFLGTFVGKQNFGITANVTNEVITTLCP